MASEFGLIAQSAERNADVFPSKRPGDRLIFDGDTNNIVDISSNVVVLSASSTGKRTMLKLNAAQ